MAVAIAMIGFLPHVARAEDGTLTIHVMNFADQDAVVLECDGHFAMVDAGEDSDYPDGTDVRYPYRPGTTVGHGHEDEVIAYLESLGATSENFDFFIGTHAHSDHIGAADEVIREFKPQRVYIPDYSDAYISNSSGLYDNQYVFDHVVEATEEVGATLITSLDPDAPLYPEEGGPGSPSFDLGSAQITIMNWDGHELYKGAYLDANDYCWGVLVSYGGHTAFLAGDINNANGDETKLVNQLGHVDVVNLSHHANTSDFLNGLSPSIVIQTMSFSMLPTSIVDTLLDLGCHHYVGPESAQQGLQSIDVVMSPEGIDANALADSDAVYFRVGCGSHAIVAYQDGAPVPYSGIWVSDSGRVYEFDDSPYGILVGTSESGGMWRKDARGWKWLNADGTYPSSQWATINGKTYYFDASGYMKVGWLEDNGQWYYLDKSGALHMGWGEVGGNWYYFDPNKGGAMATGWVQENGTWYHLADSGVMDIGWKKISRKWYYLKPSGAMATGWQKIDGRWFRFNPETGVLVTGFFTLDGSRYFAQSDGVCPSSAWIRSGLVWYRASASCALCSGWAKVGSSWYWFDPESNIMAADGWADIDGVRYYFDASGAMATGWRKVNGAWYWFGSSGALATTGWCKVSGSWYWLDPETGVMATGWLDDGGARYYLASSGKMATGWQKIDGSWYLFASSGKMTTGWQKSSGKWYWLDLETGIMLTDGRTPDGSYVDKNGAWVPGR